MSSTLPTFGPIAPSLHALRGLRFIDGPDGAQPASQPSGDAATPSEPTGTPQTPETAPQGQESAPQGEQIDSLPEWAQRIIRDTRKEAGDYRTRAKAASDEAQRIKDQAAIALGLKTPEAPADPAVSAALKAAKDATTALQVDRAARALGVDVDALSDSATFLASVSALDHTSSTFPADVKAAISAAAASNPTLRTARAAGASAPDTAGPTGETGAISEAQLASASPEQVVEWLEAGRLTHLL